MKLEGLLVFIDNEIGRKCPVIKAVNQFVLTGFFFLSPWLPSFPQGSVAAASLGPVEFDMTITKIDF